MEIYICNDLPFYMVVLEGYGVVRIYIVVLGHNNRMFGCLGNLVMCLPPRRWRRWRQATPRGREPVCLGRSSEQVLRKYVSLLSDNVNCRNYKYITVCDISLCCNMDLTMYSNIYEDCVANPRGDKCWIVR